METAEPSDRCDTPDGLRRSMERSILVERKVRTHPVVVGGVIRQQMAEVSFPQHHDMVEALASDRANQPFDMTVLHGERGAIGRSRMPMACSRRVTAAPYEVSRSRMR